MKKNVVLAAILGVALSVSSVPLWAAKAEMTRAAQEDQAKEALQALRQAYVDGDSEGFFKHVSWHSFFNTLELKFQLSGHLRDFSQPDLHIVMDHAMVENDKVVLKTHWQKRAVRNSNGNVENSQGQAQFVFKSREHGAKLIDIQGQNPF